MREEQENAVRCLCAMLMLVLFTPSVHGQETTGTIEGRVTDTLNVPLAGAVVTVRSGDLQGERVGATNSQGIFMIPALPIGKYDVRISFVGFTDATVSGVRVRLGATAAIGDVRLRERTLALPEVTVLSTQPAIDPGSAEVGGSLVPEEFETLPVERTYDRIVILLPQANESYLGDGVNVGGATGMENRYFIDGVEVSDPYRGLTGASLPYNIIREIEVKNGAYEAEYRGTLGGVVNVVTLSGGNTFSGRVFGYFTNNNLSGTPRGGSLEPAKGSFSQFDVGFGLGGPIIKDRLWFFTAYSPTFRTEEVEVPGTGYHPDRTISHVFAGNMTWKVSDHHSLQLSISGDPTSRDAVGQTFGEFGTPVTFLNPDPYLGKATLGGLGVRLKGTHLVSEELLLESSLSWLGRNDRFLPATAVGESQPLFVDEATGTWSGGYPMRVDNRSTVLGASLRGTLSLEEHLLKAGMEYRENRLAAEFRVALIQRFSPFAYTTIDYSSAGTIVNRGLSAFIQDSWNISRYVTLNGGIRWDGQFIIGSDGRVAQRILGQWQPRAGLLIRPLGDGSDKISASYGRFAQDLLTYASTLYHIAGATQRVIAYPQDPRIATTPSRPLVNVVSTIQPEIEGMRGQSYDEFTLGYERQLPGEWIAGARGVFRRLVDAIEDAEDPVGSRQLTLGNPGRGPLSAYPMPRRNYSGLELVLRRTANANPWFLVSYVLSRNEGNYPGLFNSDFEVRLPNANKSFDYLENLTNGTGVLPNDRTHILKLSASYRFDAGLTLGLFSVWQSGTPLSIFGGSRAGGFTYNFLSQRGTAGRTPALLDVSARVAYDLPAELSGGMRIRLVADVVHIGSKCSPVDYEQIQYFNVDANGNQVDPNPIYGQATRFQPPMSLRIGLEGMF